MKQIRSALSLSLSLTIAFLASLTIAMTVMGCGRMYVLDSLKGTPIGSAEPAKPREKTFTEKRTPISAFYGWYETLERDSVPVQPNPLPEHPNVKCSVVAQIGNSNLKRTTVEDDGRKTTTHEMLVNYFDPVTKQKILSDSVWISSSGIRGFCEGFVVALFADRGTWTPTEDGVKYYFEGDVLELKDSTKDQFELVKLKIELSIAKVSDKQIRVVAKRSDLNASWGSDFLLEERL